jgi:hypothetical protein
MRTREIHARHACEVRGRGRRAAPAGPRPRGDDPRQLSFDFQAPTPAPACPATGRAGRRREWLAEAARGALILGVIVGGLLL